jgi:GT2 family glycosyltransferase
MTTSGDRAPLPELDVTVVVVTFRSADELPGCLASIRAAAGDLAVEVVVVDNASDDRSAAIAREAGATEVIANRENLGFARAVNQAIAVSRGRSILLLNPDCILAAEAVRVLAKFLDDHPKAGAVAPRTRDGLGQLVRSCRAFPSVTSLLARVTGLARRFPTHHVFGAETLTYWDYASERPVDYASGACLLLRKAALDQVGTFDEAYFMYVEEMDLSWRLWRAGWEVWFTPFAEVSHQGGRSAAKVKQAHGFEPLLLEAYYSGQIRFWRRYRGELSLLVWRAIVAGSQLAPAARWVLKGLVASGAARDAAFNRVRRAVIVARLVLGREAGSYAR